MNIVTATQLRQTNETDSQTLFRKGQTNFCLLGFTSICFGAEDWKCNKPTHLYCILQCLFKLHVIIPSPFFLSLPLSAITDAVKCEHERSIHLFIDSLLNEQEVAKAYRCGSNDMFDRGMCLSCRKSRCNTVGYGISKVRRARNVQMYTKTRSSMPFRGQQGDDTCLKSGTKKKKRKEAQNHSHILVVGVWSLKLKHYLQHVCNLNAAFSFLNDIHMWISLSVYHYQMKIHFSSKVNTSEMEPSLTVSLYGTKGEAENLELKLWVNNLNLYWRDLQQHDLHLPSYEWFCNCRTITWDRDNKQWCNHVHIYKVGSLPSEVITMFYGYYIMGLLRYAVTFLCIFLAERTDLWQIRRIHSCWWQKKILVTCWCWSLNGRRQTAGQPLICWRWFPLGGLVTQTALTWRFTKSASELARPNKSKLKMNIKSMRVMCECEGLGTRVPRSPGLSVFVTTRDEI